MTLPLSSLKKTQTVSLMEIKMIIPVQFLLKNAWSVKKKKAQVTLKKNALIVRHAEQLKILPETVKTLIPILPLLKNLKIRSQN